MLFMIGVVCDQNGGLCIEIMDVTLINNQDLDALMQLHIISKIDLCYTHLIRTNLLTTLEIPIC